METREPEPTEIHLQDLGLGEVYTLAEDARIDLVRPNHPFTNLLLPAGVTIEFVGKNEVGSMSLKLSGGIVVLCEKSTVGSRSIKVL